MSLSATRAAAPPPTVLNTETSCGMSVILTLFAEATPATAPMMMPAISSQMAIAFSNPVMNSLTKAMTTATTMPAAEMKLPLRAVFGEFM